jgi:hypothetical protein
MTRAQRSYLETLATEAGEPAKEDLTKAEASKRIDELQEMTGRGAAKDRAESSTRRATQPSGARH